MNNVVPSPNTIHHFSRFGWYMPEAFAAKSPPIKDHWRAFRDPKVTSLFSPSEADEKFILEQMKAPDGR